jgi:hypothetical protein
VVRLPVTIAFAFFFGLASTTMAAEERDACMTACIDIFGGALPIPAGYRLQTDFGDTLRFVRIDRDPRKQYGNIYIGKIESLPPSAEREKSARDLGAHFERQTRGALKIEVTTRTTKQLLVDKTVRYVSALIHDSRHYVRITDSDPDLWKQMIEQCKGCARP